MQLPSFFKRFLKNEKEYNPAQWTPIGPVDTAERNLLANNKEWVFIAIDRIASSVAGIGIKVMRYQKNGDDVEVFDGPMVEFLETPAPNFTGKDFVYLNTVYKELTGNAFWERNGKKLMPLNPTLVSPIITNGVITAYKYSDNGKERVIDAKNMLHDRYVDPARPHWGVGKLAKIARWVDTSSYANEFLRRFFLNGATFGGFIETDEESEERIKLIKAGLANDHVGVENAHKIAVLPKNSKYTQGTANMSDIEMGMTDDRYRDKILAGFGVPKTLVGLTTEVNRASAVASEYIFARYTLKPIVEDLLEFLNNNIAPVLDPTGKFYFETEDYIPEDEEIEIRERESALNRQPYKTVNEVRADCGLPPVKGGDTIYGNPFQVPLGDPTPEPVVPDTPVDTPNDTPAGDPKKAMPKRMRVIAKRERVIEDIMEKASAVVTAHHDPDEESHKAFIARINQHEKLVAQTVRDFNNRQQRDVIQNLTRITKGINKGDLFDMDGEVGILVDFVSPLLQGLMLEQAISEYQAQQFPGSFDTSKSSIVTVIERASKRLARSYNDTTAQLLKTALNDGINAGDDIKQLAERVQSVYAYSDQVRAMSVARTESVYIANAGSKEAYRQSGVVKSIRWYTAEDEVVCEYCGPMDGEVISTTETFFNKGETVEGRDGGQLSTDYRAIDVPPLHTNCRCIIRPETIEVG